MDPSSKAHDRSIGAYDYVIVGAGSAGCVLADRLTRGGARVLLLEAGAADRHPFLHIPAGFSKAIGDPAFDWGFVSEDEAGLGGRRMYCPRGKVLGGSSSINAMAYVRGQPADFDEWRQLGNPGWAWDDVRPIFEAMEDYRGPDGEGRGHAGPTRVSVNADPHPIGPIMLDAFHQAGFPKTDDYNAPNAAGVTRIQCNIRNGWRDSAATAYLAAARKRRTLRLETDALVTRVLMDGRRATGVRFLQGRQVVVAHADKDVILSAGAVKSPHLLELSGVGNAELLRRHGIEIVHDLPGVGGNLQDHLFVQTRFHLRNITTLNQQLSGPGLLGQILRYLAFRDGILATGPTLLTGFGRVDPTSLGMDTQFYANGASYSFGTGEGEPALSVDKFPGVVLAGTQCKPASRGSIHLTSGDPAAPPEIRINFLSEERDRRHAIGIVRACRKVFAQPAFDRYRGGENTAPDEAVQSDEDILDYVRETANTAFHLVGTCKMGVDELAVVDGGLRVRGVAGLRVIDASIMPTLVSGNTNAATIMIAEHAARQLSAE